MTGNNNIKEILRKYLPYLLIVAGFTVIAYLYAPYVLQGKLVNQSDISSWKGMSHEILEHNEAHPDDPALWTGSMFGGMPATQISVQYKGDLTDPLYNLLFWGERPPSYLILSLLGGFLLFLAFGMNPWLSAVGAIAITFCSYNMQIIQVGHNTKMIAIALMPWVLASAVYAYRRKSLLGAVFFALTLGFQIKANHPQITYYLAIILFGYVIAELCSAANSKTLQKWLKTSVLILVAGLAGIATNANKLLPTYEYAAYTMRGGSELTHDEDNQTGNGLKLDYATAWSYGIEETPNLLIPNFNGGASSGELSKKSASYSTMSRYYSNAESLRKGMPLYWGPQPFTAGPMYMGAISIFLFVLGLCIIRNRYKWWIAGVSLLALLLAWGSHFMWFSELFFKYAPLYNKFRTVSMILVILQITIPVMGILAVNELLYGDHDTDKNRIKNGLFISLGITGGFCLLFSLFPSLAGDFASSSDAMFGRNTDLIEALRHDRRILLRNDAFRSLLFILASAGVLYAAYMKKLKALPAIAVLGCLILADLWTVDKRYLNKSHFVTARNFDRQFTPRPVDNAILQDKDPDYRILDLSVNTFNDAIVSYHHKTIGGYSPAKLQRYQDMIDFHLSKEMALAAADINSTAGTASTYKEIEDALGYYPVLAMLNTKYIVIDGNAAPLRYKHSLGNAWLVSSSVSASTADAEMETLGSIDPASEAVIFDTEVSDGTVASYPSEGSIQLTSYSPNRLTYKCDAPEGGLAVFSEIYYPAGWKAFVDGKETEIIRADYILRALKLESGAKEIEFIYAPASFKTGKNISIASSSLILLALLACIIAGCLGLRKKNEVR